MLLAANTRTGASERGAIGLAWLIAIGLIISAVAGSFFITLPYFSLAPGSARLVDDLIKVPEDQNHPPKGQVLLTTVSLSRVHPFEAFRGWLDPDTDVVPEDQILGPTPQDNFEKQSFEEMDDSIQVAEVVALRRLGYEVKEVGTGALVNKVTKGSPAEGHLKAGDVITKLEKTPITTSTEFIDAMEPRKFGQTVKVEVKTGEQPVRIETIKLGGAKEDKSSCSASEPLSGKGCLGIQLSTKNHSYSNPIDVHIDSAGIGGPSAGLAFTLGVLDKLRPGELTGGHKIAVTGTISLDCVVGDVGGVVQKTAAVKASGAEAFLVPPGEFEDAKAHAGPKLKVFKVATLEEALQAMARLGGDLAAIGAAPAQTSGTGCR
jgi:PDZ domain-containing protein